MSIQKTIALRVANRRVAELEDSVAELESQVERLKTHNRVLMRRAEERQKELYTIASELVHARTGMRDKYPGIPGETEMERYCMHCRKPLGDHKEGCPVGIAARVLKG